jgi:hypothetical protein
MFSKIKHAVKTLIGTENNSLKTVIWLFILFLPLGMTFNTIISLKWVFIVLLLLLFSINLEETIAVLKRKG